MTVLGSPPTDRGLLTGPAGMTAAEYAAYLESLGVSRFVVPVTH